MMPRAHQDERRGGEYKKSARRDEVKDTDLGSIQLVLANDFDCDDEEWGEYDAVILTSHREMMALTRDFLACSEINSLVDIGKRSTKRIELECQWRVTDPGNPGSNSLSHLIKQFESL
jgi:hypothetical protein